MKGWEKARGCKIEHQVAVEYGKEIMYCNQEERIMKRKWTKESAEKYIKNAKQKGLTYWSAIDYLKKHKTMSSII